jgi:hypothetical protein
MQALFVLIASSGLAYLLLTRRRFDVFALAFVSACAYFLPGFSGEVPYYSGLGILDPRVPLLGETYVVMISVLGMLLAATVVADRLKPPDVPTLRLAGTENAAAAATCLAVAGFAMSLLTIGADVLMDPDKHLILDRLNRWHTLWALGAVLGAVFSYLRKAWLCFGVSGGLLIADLYVGFRSEFALAVIAVFLLAMHDEGLQRFLIRNWRMALLGMAAAAFLFFYKMIIFALKLGDAELLTRIISSPETYLSAITSSEPFYTQATLNEVIRQDFQVGFDHLYGVAYLLVPFAAELGAEIRSFNDLFQPALFPAAIETGLASNIWAQMISTGGWTLLLVFMVIFTGVVAAASSLMRIPNLELRGGVAVLASYWAFYIHRNDIAFQLTLERGVLLMVAVILLISMGLHAMLEGGRPRGVAGTKQSSP